MVSLAPWLWAAYALLAGVTVALLLRRSREDQRPRVVRVRRALVGAAVLVSLFAVVFLVMPEVAVRGGLPSTWEASICDESPGSGCAACTASAEEEGLDPSSCYEGQLTAEGLTMGLLGPVTRGRALDEARRRGLLP